MTGTQAQRLVKCTVVGDERAGKTAMLMSYVTNTCPRSYCPTIFDYYSVSVHVDGDPCTLELYDTAGQAEYDSLRTLAYARTDVFVVCFSVVRPSSLNNACDKWIREIRQRSPRVPVVLVGTQTDLREDAMCVGRLVAKGQRPVTTMQAEATAKRVGAAAYIECSAVAQSGMKNVFDAAILASLGLTPKLKKDSEARRKKVQPKPWKSALTGIARLGQRLVCA